MNGEQYELPEGWQWAELAQVAEIGSEQVLPKRQPDMLFNYVALENVEQGTGRLIDFAPTRGADIASNKYRFAPEHVLYGKLRPYLQKALIPDFEGISATDLLPLKPNPEILDRRYLWRWLLSYDVLEYVTARQTGVKMPRLRTGDLEAMPVPLPPLSEQGRIVEKIERLFAESRTAREALDKVPALLKRFRQSVLAKAFRGELTERDPNDEPASVLLEQVREEWRRKWGEGKGVKSKKYVEPEPPDASDLPELPLGWKWTTVEQITENFDGRRVPVKDADRKKRQGSYPYYGASGIIDSVDKYLFDGTYLLIGEDGANLLSRSTPIAFQASGKFWVNNHAHVLQTYSGMPLGYVEHYFNKIDLSPHVTGTAQPKLTQKNMNSISIPLAPLAEQRRIVAKIESLFAQAEAIERAVEVARRRAAKVDQAVLARAFRGEL